VSTAGDVNGDGYADVIVGGPYYDNPEVDAGLSSVNLGSDSGLSPAWAWEVGGHEAGAEFGYAVSTAGDVNGDGYAEVIVGAPYKDHMGVDEGLAYVYYGNWTNGWPLRPRQMETDWPGDSVIAPLGLSNSFTDVGLWLTLHIPLGLRYVRLHWQVAPIGVSFTHPSVIEDTEPSWGRHSWMASESPGL
jgi:hypothetical protein